MSKLIQFRPALVTVAAGAALAGTLTVAGTASATSRAGDAHGAKLSGAAGPSHSGRGTGPHRPSTPFSDWPMLRADAGHSGVSPETAISTTTASSLTSQWTATLGSQSDTSPAVARSASLGKALVYAGADNHLYAYPAGGGAAVWSYKLATGVVETSPAVANGVVYFGSTTGRMYAVNASTGALECSYNTGQAILASPVVVNDPDGSGPVVYDGTVPSSANGGEYAIYGPGNTHGACTKDWEFTAFAVSPAGSWSSPAYSTGATGVPELVFGSRDSDDSVYALNANTGALVWRYRTSTADLADVGAPPTVSAPGVNGFAGGAVYVTGKDKIVYALNLTTGKLIWKHGLAVGTHGDLSGSSLVGDRIYLGSDTGVYALNASTGAPVWHALSQAVFYASPAVTGPAARQVLMIGSNEGTLYALSLATGATLWAQQAARGGFWASPAISQGAVYVAGLDGVLRSYAPRS